MASWRLAQQPGATQVVLLVACNVLVLVLAGAALTATAGSSPRLVADSTGSSDHVAAAAPMANASLGATAQVGDSSPIARSTSAAATPRSPFPGLLRARCAALCPEPRLQPLRR